jgi:hypothetical protein
VSFPRATQSLSGARKHFLRGSGSCCCWALLFVLCLRWLFGSRRGISLLLSLPLKVVGHHLSRVVAKFFGNKMSCFPYAADCRVLLLSHRSVSHKFQRRHEKRDVQPQKDIYPAHVDKLVSISKVQLMLPFLPRNQNATFYHP